MTSNRRTKTIMVAAGLLLGNFYLIVANLVLLLRGHSDRIPLSLVRGGFTSIIGYAFVFGVYVTIFAFPLIYLRTYLRAKTRSARLAFIVSLLLIMVGAVAVTWGQVEADVLYYLENPQAGGGAAFGFVLVFLYLPIALVMGVCAGLVARKVCRD